jgi:hypothetical protein
MNIQEWADAKMYTEEYCGLGCGGMIVNWELGPGERQVTFTLERGGTSGKAQHIAKFFKKYEKLTLEEFKQQLLEKGRVDKRAEYDQGRRNYLERYAFWSKEIFESDDLTQGEKLFLLSSAYEMAIHIRTEKDWVKSIAERASMEYDTANAWRFGHLEHMFRRLQSNLALFQDKKLP